MAFTQGKVIKIVIFLGKKEKRMLSVAAFTVVSFDDHTIRK